MGPTKVVRSESWLGHGGTEAGTAEAPGARRPNGGRPW